MNLEHWQDRLARCFGVVFDGRAQASGILRPAADATLLLILNSYHDVVRFHLPPVRGGSRWELLVDTNLPEQEDLVPFEFGHDYEVTGRSLLLFALRSASRKNIIRHAEKVFQALAQQSVPIPSASGQIEAGKGVQQEGLHRPPAR